jgi:hypothetical protein
MLRDRRSSPASSGVSGQVAPARDGRRRGSNPRGPLAALAVLAACGAGASEPAPLGKVLAAALAAADRVRAPWRCAALDPPALSSETIAGWRSSGHVLERTTPGDVTIGVIADAAGSSPVTIAALARLRGKLDAAHPVLLLALGGMGTTRDELTATVGTLSDHADYPVVALPGDLEAMPAYLAALAALRRRGDPVVDGRLARWLELPGATIATVPGAGAAGRLVAGDDGCAWHAAEVTAIYTELAKRPGLRIAATAEAPRRIVGGEATGELALRAGVPIDLAVHGAAAASPARSGHRDGAAIALSPGSSDATTRVPSTGGPSAGLLALHDGAWSWTPLVDTK